MQVFKKFAERDPCFLERLAALPKHGRKRRYLVRTREELYPDSPHKCESVCPCIRALLTTKHGNRGAPRPSQQSSSE